MESTERIPSVEHSLLPTSHTLFSFNSSDTITPAPTLATSTRSPEEEEEYLSRQRYKSYLKGIRQAKAAQSRAQEARQKAAAEETDSSTEMLSTAPFTHSATLTQVPASTASTSNTRLNVTSTIKTSVSSGSKTTITTAVALLLVVNLFL